MVWILPDVNIYHICRFGAFFTVLPEGVLPRVYVRLAWSTIPNTGSDMCPNLLKNALGNTPARRSVPVMDHMLSKDFKR